MQVKTKECEEDEDYPSTSNQTNYEEKETNEAPEEQITVAEKTPYRYV